MTFKEMLSKAVSNDPTVSSKRIISLGTSIYFVLFLNMAMLTIMVLIMVKVMPATAPSIALFYDLFKSIVLYDFFLILLINGLITADQFIQMWGIGKQASLTRAANGTPEQTNTTNIGKVQDQTVNAGSVNEKHENH